MFSLTIRRCWILLAALLLLHLTAAAQPAPYYFSLPDAAHAQVITGAANSAWHVARVLDARADRARLGTVRRGLDNLPAPAMLQHPLPAAVLAYCNQQLPPRPGTQPVVLRVLTLQVADDVRASSEHGDDELIGEFLLPQADSSYRVLLPVAELLRHSGLDVTLHHPENLGLALNQALARLAALPLSAADAALPLTHDDALAGRGGGPAYPVLATPPSMPGAYRKLDDFRTNTLTPINRPFELVRTRRSKKGPLANADEMEAYFLFLDSSHPRELMQLGSLWGLTDGHTRYIVREGRLYPLLPGTDGRSVTFEALAPPDMAGSATRAIAGGVLGGAIGGAIAAANGPRAGLTTYEVHLPTGRLLAREVPPTFVSDTPDAGQVYLYRRPDNVGTEPLLVLLNGREIGRLLPKQYLRLPVPNPHTELVLCVQRPTAKGVTAEITQLLQAPFCLPVAPESNGPVYVECEAAPAATQPPSFHVVATRTGSAQVNQFRPAE